MALCGDLYLVVGQEEFLVLGFLRYDLETGRNLSGTH